jgi:hypothetical protein
MPNSRRTSARRASKKMHAGVKKFDYRNITKV